KRLASDDVTTAEPEAEGATPAESSSHSIAASSNPEHASVDEDERSTIAAAVSSVSDTVSAQASNAADSVAQSTGSVRESITGTAEAFAAGAGLRSPQRDQDQRGGAFREGGRGPPQAPASKSLYVGNLYFDVTEEDLKKEMERFGTVQSVKIIYDGRGLSKGFGYVEFDQLDQSAKAIEGLNQQVFEGRRLSVQYTVKKDPQRAPGAGGARNPPSKTLFIGNMSFDMSDKDLNELFREIHNVIDVRVAIDRKTGQPRGFAHADFIDVSSAVKAYGVLRDKEVYGRKLRIDYSQPSQPNRRMPDQPPTT
ncbi:MAG: hypothetical protein M1830_007393, partial [Pleopsidium flavum]